MVNARTRLFLHLLFQILGLGAVQVLVPESGKQLFTAIVAIVGVIVAFFDQSAARAQS